MASILFAALLATTATAADITTSIWLPGAATANQTFLGSIIERNGETTILSLAFSGTPATPAYVSTAPPKVTVAGTTRVVLTDTASDPEASGSPPQVIYEMDCTRASGGISVVPTCTVVTKGVEAALSAVCAGLTIASAPAYCTNSDAQTLKETLTLSGESQYYLNNYPLIITAGTEKIAASTAGTPRSQGASATGPASGSITGSASGSAVQATGAAASMKTIAPALAGIGAAAALLL